MSRQKKIPEELYLVRADVLPDVFLKVMEAKRLLDYKLVPSVNEAVRRVGLSRSAYYKYRKAIRSTSSGVEGSMITIIIVIENLSHSLTRCLEVLLESDVSLMSLHQSIPIRGLAHVLVTFRSDDMNMPLDRLISLIAQTRGVLSVQILTPQP